jgi:hypothetical protein
MVGRKEEGRQRFVDYWLVDLPGSPPGFIPWRSRAPQYAGKHRALGIPLS